ncbi:MAG: hypothetical protein DBY16_00840 [Coprobacter sp.]|nr:MAG: hypothetical protein DBY16_00840 [Coprobacter sp.]
MFLSVGLPGQNSVKQWDFSGRWNWEYVPDSTESVFSMTLLPPEKSGKIIGDYTYVFYYGRLSTRVP